MHSAFQYFSRRELACLTLFFTAVAAAMSLWTLDLIRVGRSEHLILEFAGMSLGMWLVTLLSRCTYLEKLNLGQPCGSAIRYGALHCIILGTVFLAMAMGLTLSTGIPSAGMFLLVVPSVMTIRFGGTLFREYALAS